MNFSTSKIYFLLTTNIITIFHSPIKSWLIKSSPVLQKYLQTIQFNVEMCDNSDIKCVVNIF